MQGRRIKQSDSQSTLVAARFTSGTGHVSLSRDKDMGIQTFDLFLRYLVEFFAFSLMGHCSALNFVADTEMNHRNSRRVTIAVMLTHINPQANINEYQ